MEKLTETLGSLAEYYWLMFQVDMENLGNWNYCWPVFYFVYFFIKWYVLTLPFWLPVRMGLGFPLACAVSNIKAKLEYKK